MTLMATARSDRRCGRVFARRRWDGRRVRRGRRNAFVRRSALARRSGWNRRERGLLARFLLFRMAEEAADHVPEIAQVAPDELIHQVRFGLIDRAAHFEIERSVTGGSWSG